MRICSINCGSSSLKVELFEVADTNAAVVQIASGTIDRIGKDATVEFQKAGQAIEKWPAAAGDHADATRMAIQWLEKENLIGQLDGVGHRIVHGADQFTGPVLIDDKVLMKIDALKELAPLHNGISVTAIRSAREQLGAKVPMVAVFDTSFHRTLPEQAALYAVPIEWSRDYRVRRYGFHGIAHEYMAASCARLLSRPLTELRLITLQLGNGCSACAIDGGRSVDTSMGFTPLEGLMMGTRSGDLDPSVPGFIASRTNRPISEIDEQLNRQCGLAAVSGLSRDMRELEAAAAQGHARAALSIEMFCYRIKKTIGAYLSVLSGADAVAFGGGIGEHSTIVRERICSDLAWCGLVLDLKRNASMKGVEGRISAPESAIHALVTPVNEASSIAKATAACLRRPTDQPAGI